MKCELRINVINWIYQSPKDKGTVDIIMKINVKKYIVRQLSKENSNYLK